MKYRPMLLLSALGLLLAPGLSHADTATSSTSSAGYATPPPIGQPSSIEAQSRFREGKGWFLSGDLGLGGVGITASDGSNDHGSSAMFFHLRFGGMLSKRLALSAELWSDGYDDDDEFLQVQRYTQNVLALAATYWVRPRFWFTAGMGSATMRDYSWSEPVAYDGSAFMVGTGYELMHRDNYSVDLTFRLVSSSYATNEWGDSLGRTSAAVGLGATWH